MNESMIAALTVVGANIGLIAIMIGTIVMIWLHTDKKIDAIHGEIKIMQNEMRDFHVKLAQQDYEFKKQLIELDQKRGIIKC